MRFGVAFLWMLLAGGAAALLFHVSYQVEAVEERLDGTRRDIVQETKALRVLEAEWGWLNQPDRLEALAVKHLHMVPAAGDRFVTLASVPEKPVAPVAEEAGSVTQTGEAGFKTVLAGAPVKGEAP